MRQGPPAPPPLRCGRVTNIINSRQSRPAPAFGSQRTSASPARREYRRRCAAYGRLRCRAPPRAKPALGVKRRRNVGASGRRWRRGGRGADRLGRVPCGRPPPQAALIPPSYLLFVVRLGDAALRDDFAGIHLVVGEIGELVDPREAALKHTQKTPLDRVNTGRSVSRHPRATQARGGRQMTKGLVVLWFAGASLAAGSHLRQHRAAAAGGGRSAADYRRGHLAAGCGGASHGSWSADWPQRASSPGPHRAGPRRRHGNG